MKKAPAYQTEALRDLGELIRGRRTIDQYLQTPVSPQLIEEAIEVARWAPNHHVTEPWHFYSLGAQSILACLDLCRDIVAAKKGDKAGDFKRDSWSKKPGWLVLSCRRSDDELLRREDYAACTTALQNLMLYLWKAGVGSKWTTGDITRDARFTDIVGFDPNEEFVVALLWYGYPKLTPTQSRQGVDEILSRRP